MPLYTYACDHCQSTVEMFRSIEDRNTTMSCACGTEMKLVIYAPNVYVREGVTDRLNRHYKERMERVAKGEAPPLRKNK